MREITFVVEGRPDPYYMRRDTAYTVVGTPESVLPVWRQMTAQMQGYANWETYCRFEGIDPNWDGRKDDSLGLPWTPHYIRFLRELRHRLTLAFEVLLGRHDCGGEW